MKRILAFEGDNDFAERLQFQLGKHGCVVDVARDGDTGFKKIEKKRPDLILLSIELPGTNGFSICNRLKKDSRFKKIPLIVLSGECTEATFEAHRQMRTRAEDYLLKPFEFKWLLEKVDKLVGLDVPPDRAPQLLAGAEEAGSDEYLREQLDISQLSDLVQVIEQRYDELRETEDQQPESARPNPAVPDRDDSWSPEKRRRGSSQPPELDRTSDLPPSSAVSSVPPRRAT